MGLNERSLTIEKQMIVRAKQKVLSATSWFTQAELASLTGVPSLDLEVQMRAWKETKMIFSVLHERVELFPVYAFTDDRLQPLVGLQAIRMLLAGRKDDWGMAYWFAGANGYLGGKRPQDVLRINPDEVLLAAEDELAGVTHG
jgi:hypothetical protein